MNESINQQSVPRTAHPSLTTFFWSESTKSRLLFTFLVFIITKLNTHIVYLWIENNTNKFLLVQVFESHSFMSVLRLRYLNQLSSVTSILGFCSWTRSTLELWYQTWLVATLWHLSAHNSSPKSRCPVERTGIVRFRETKFL